MSSLQANPALIYIMTVILSMTYIMPMAHINGLYTQPPPKSTCSLIETSLNTLVEDILQINDRIVFKNKADQMLGYEAGDIIIILQQIPDTTFQRENQHLYDTKEIVLVEALCGGEFYIKHSDGRILKFTTRTGEVSAPYQIKCIPNKGIPFKDNINRRGHIFVQFESLDIIHYKLMKNVINHTINIDNAINNTANNKINIRINNKINNNNSSDNSGSIIVFDSLINDTKYTFIAVVLIEAYDIKKSLQNICDIFRGAAKPTISADAPNARGIILSLNKYIFDGPSVSGGYDGYVSEGTGSVAFAGDGISHNKCAASIYGTKYLLFHGLDSIHRDLKPENLVLDSRHHLKFADFGINEYIFIGGPRPPQPHILLNGYKGDEYASPTPIPTTPYSFETDILIQSLKDPASTVRGTNFGFQWMQKYLFEGFKDASVNSLLSLPHSYVGSTPISSLIGASAGDGILHNEENYKFNVLQGMVMAHNKEDMDKIVFDDLN